MFPRATNAARVPFQVADCFVLALDDFMRRTRQGGHVSQSVLDARPPAVTSTACARAAAVRAAKHPLLAARPVRDFWTRLPYWSVPATSPERGLPLGRLAGGRHRGEWTDAAPTDDAREACCERIDERPAGAPDGVSFNARVDAVALRDGGCLAALSWSHLLLDGKGAELLLRRTRPALRWHRPARRFRPAAAARPRARSGSKFRQTKPAMDHQTGLQETGVPSLGGPKPRRGRGFYEVVTFDAADSDRVRARIEATGRGAVSVHVLRGVRGAGARPGVPRTGAANRAGYGISVPDANPQARRARADLSQPRRGPVSSTRAASTSASLETASPP